MDQEIASLTHVKKKFFQKRKELDVIDDISFSIKENEIIALVGPSGSGKTTIFNLLSGLLEPDEGSISLNCSLGYMFQRDNLFEWLTIRKNIALGLEIKGQKDKNSYELIEDLSKRYGLEGFLDNYPSELSGGMRQRVALLRTLVLKPGLLLLDEPFSALDYITKLSLEDDVYRIIKNLKISAMIVTHDISEALAFSDRIYVLSTRPCRIKNIYDLDLKIEGEKCPNNARKAPNFKDYFSKIVEDLR